MFGGSRSVDAFVSGKREEVGEFIRMGEPVEHPDRLVDAAGAGHAQLVDELAGQADEGALQQGEIDRGAVVQVQRLEIGRASCRERV